MKYDVTLKEILQARAPKLWQALTGGTAGEISERRFGSLPDLALEQVKLSPLND